MTTDQPNTSERTVKRRGPRAARALNQPKTDEIVIRVERSGEWMPVEELRDAALQAVAAGQNAAIDLDKVAHLDASALQILLALDVEQKKRGRTLQLRNASPGLRQWFEYSGASERFFADSAK